jgi:hypothetical protein
MKTSTLSFSVSRCSEVASPERHGHDLDEIVEDVTGSFSTSTSPWRGRVLVESDRRAFSTILVPMAALYVRNAMNAPCHTKFVGCMLYGPLLLREWALATFEIMPGGGTGWTTLVLDCGCLTAMACTKRRPQ